MFIGQQKIRETLDIIAEACRNANRQFPHILFEGYAGHGKSTLARMVSQKMDGDLKEINAATIRKPNDVIDCLMTLEPNTYLFIDEIHRLPLKTQEVLYTACEDWYVNDNVLDKVLIERFTLIGATTSVGLLSHPMKSRFKHVFQLEGYSNEEIRQIAEKYSRTIDFEIDSTPLIEYCRNNPRLAKDIVEWVRDFCQAKKISPVEDSIHKAMRQKGVYQEGLTVRDIDYLEFVYKSKSWVGLETISNCLGVDKLTIRDFIEPYLVKRGYLLRGKRGRYTTQKAARFLKNVKET